MQWNEEGQRRWKQVRKLWRIHFLILITSLTVFSLSLNISLRRRRFDGGDGQRFCQRCRQRQQAATTTTLDGATWRGAGGRGPPGTTTLAQLGEVESNGSASEQDVARVGRSGVSLVCANFSPFLLFLPLTTFFVYPPPHPAAGAPPPAGLLCLATGAAALGMCGVGRRG